MKQGTKINIYFFTSLIAAIWFAATSYFWAYYMNIIISLPLGILSLVCWHYGKKIDPNPKKYYIVHFILGVGVLLALFFLFFVTK